MILTRAIYTCVTTEHDYKATVWEQTNNATYSTTMYSNGEFCGEMEFDSLEKAAARAIKWISVSFEGK